MSEGIDDAADAPAVFLDDGIDLRGAGCESASEECIGIGYSQDDADGTAAQGLRAEVEMFGRLVTHPKLCAFDGEPCDDAAAGVEAKNFDGSEGGLVVVNGVGAVAD